MDFTDINLDYYIIDEGGIEKLIEIWKHFNKKDEPYPNNNGRIFLNKKYPDVEPINLLLNLVYPCLKTLYWAGRFYNSCLHLRTQDPMKFIYDKFIENYKTKKIEEKIEIFDEIELQTNKKVIKEIPKNKEINKKIINKK